MKENFKIINEFLDYICNNDIILKEKLLQFIAGVSPLTEDGKLYVILNIKGLNGNKDIFYFSKWLSDLIEYKQEDKTIIIEDDDTLFIKDEKLNPRYQKETMMLKNDMLFYIDFGYECIYVNNNNSFSLEKVFENEKADFRILTINVDNKITLTKDKLKVLFNEKTLKEFTKILDEAYSNSSQKYAELEKSIFEKNTFHPKIYKKVLDEANKVITNFIS